MSGLFKGKTEKVTPEVTAVADPYGAVREKLNSWLSGTIGTTGPTYSGDRVAKMSDQEKQSLNKVNEYASTPIPTEWKNASNEINKTLTGSYDPATSPYYQAVKAEAARNLDLTNKQIASNAAGAGRYWSGARLKTQGDAGVATANSLNTVMGQQAENERQRMIQAVPLAQSLGTDMTELPLKQATALQTLGALPRSLQQAYLDAIYNEWNTSTREWPLKTAAIAQGVQQAPLYAQSGYIQNPSVMQQLSPMLGEVAKAGISAASGGMSNLFLPKTAVPAATGGTSSSYWNNILKSGSIG